MRSYPLPVLALLVASSMTMPLSAQIRQEDARPSKTATLVILGDVTFTARKMQIPFDQLYAVNADGVASSGAAMTIGSSIVKNAAASYIAPYVTNQLVATWMVPGPWSAVMTMAQVIWYEEVVGSHTMERCYAFYTPVETDYTIQAWVPGDWTKPCSMVKVFTTTENGTVQLLNYDQTNASDRVETFRLHMPRGVSVVKVSVGSGSVLTHNAGRLNSIALDSATPVTWTEAGIPVTSREINLIDYLPTVGSSNSESLVYTPNLRPSSLIDGTISHSNLRSAMYFQPLPPAFSGMTIDIWGEPTEEQQAQLGITITTNMDAQEMNPSQFSGGVGYFNFSRKPDVQTRFTVRGRYHLTMD